MSFSKTDGAPITLETAKKWTANYRAKNPNGVKAHFYGSDLFNHLLSLPDAVGIRIYNGLDDEGNQRLVLVAAKENENNILSNESGTESHHEYVWDDSRVCPPNCPDPDDGL